MKNITIPSVVILLALTAGASAQVKQTKSYPLYQDIGILGLHTHDLADFDSFRGDDAIDAGKTLGVSNQREDGRANLSALFLSPEVYKEEEFRGLDLGGHVKNTNQAGIFNYSQSLGRLFQQRVREGIDNIDARKWVVSRYLQDVKRSYEGVIARPFPVKAVCEPMTEVDMIPLLLFHDLIPDTIAQVQSSGEFRKEGHRQIPYYTVETSSDSLRLTDDLNDSKVLNYSQMMEPIPGFDGKYASHILTKFAFPIGYMFPISAATDREGGWKKFSKSPLPSAPDMGTLADMDRIFVRLILKRNREEIAAYKTYDQYLGKDTAFSLANLLSNATYESLLKEQAELPYEQTTSAKMFEVVMAKSLCPDEFMPPVECVGEHESNFCL